MLKWIFWDSVRCFVPVFNCLNCDHRTASRNSAPNLLPLLKKLFFLFEFDDFLLAYVPIYYVGVSLIVVVYLLLSGRSASLNYLQDDQGRGL